MSFIFLFLYPSYFSQLLFLFCSRLNILLLVLRVSPVFSNNTLSIALFLELAAVQRFVSTICTGVIVILIGNISNFS